VQHPARCSEACILCELEGASPEQAAELIGTTPNAVRSRLMRARRELERRLHARLGAGGEP
jgi:DNA-directed RNA polymerase specialized sigma24 family protein